MKKLASFFCLFSLILSSAAQAASFTMCSYNCGCLPDNYDYVRTAMMQKLMQERYQAEPELMAQVQRIQRIALQMLFSKDSAKRERAAEKWQANADTYNKILDNATHATWFEKSNNMLTNYKIRPIQIHDKDISRMLLTQVRDILRNPKTKDYAAFLTQTRTIMGNRIFKDKLPFDIICLQEADLIRDLDLPDYYAHTSLKLNQSIEVIVWNKLRFDFLKFLSGNNRSTVIELLDKETNKTILVATTHLTGCNPFQTVLNTETNLPDSTQGDNELASLLQLFEANSADLKIIAMDSNVTATHPRLAMLKENGYDLDCDNYLEPTCTNPNMLLNTRIDWIALKGDANSKITNIPVLNVGLNSIQTNISDHKPIAAKVEFQ